MLNLQDDEVVIKVFHHHPMTFVLRALNYFFVSLPFYFVAFIISTALNSWQSVAIYLGIFAVFLIITAYDLILFFLDKLVITNRRIIHVDWNSAFSRCEAEAELLDIQDITTKEMGIFAAFKMFDYGLFALETASTKTSIIFKDAPDPEGIKHFIYRLYQKPSRIESALNLNKVHDTARQIQDEEAATARSQ